MYPASDSNCRPVYLQQTFTFRSCLFSLLSLPSTSAGQSECASTPAGGAVGRTDAATRGAKHSYDADAASKVPKWFKIGRLFCGKLKLILMFQLQEICNLSSKAVYNFAFIYSLVQTGICPYNKQLWVMLGGE